jgi:hypothetical protein
MGRKIWLACHRRFVKGVTVRIWIESRGAGGGEVVCGFRDLL